MTKAAAFLFVLVLFISGYLYSRGTGLTLTRPTAGSRTATRTPTHTATPTVSPTQTSTLPSPAATPAISMAATARVFEATTHSIGIEWDVLAGDEDHNAVCEVTYNVLGSDQVHKAKLLRVDYFGRSYRCCRDECCDNAATPTPAACLSDPKKVDESLSNCNAPVDCCKTVPFTLERTANRAYRGFNMFAGSLMFLDEDTPYEVKLRIIDPPSSAAITLDLGTISTRKVPSLDRMLSSIHTPPQERYVAPDGDGCPAGERDGSATKPFCGFGEADDFSKLIGWPSGIIYNVAPGTYEGHVFRAQGAPDAYVVWRASPATTGTVRLRGPLFVRSNHVMFMGLDLKPAVGLASDIAAIAGSMSMCKGLVIDTCIEGCPKGTEDIAILGNTFEGFSQAVLAGDQLNHDSDALAQSCGGSDPVPTRVLCGKWTEPADTAAPGAAPWDHLHRFQCDPAAEDQYRANLHRHWYVADNTILGSAANRDQIYLSMTADSEVVHNRVDMLPCTGECDAIKINSSSNIDVYGNDVRDASDDAIEGDGSYANLRVWRNRTIGGASLLSMQPMASAPWYVVRNEVVGRIGTNGDGNGQLKANVFDRLVLVNNTFVVRRSQVGLSDADLLLRAISRNNLWVQEYQAAKCNAGGYIMDGLGDARDDDYLRSHGQSHGDWKTDADYDGFDWDWLPDNHGFSDNPESFWQRCGCPNDLIDCVGATAGHGIVRWFDTGSIKNNNYDLVLEQTPGPDQESLQKWSRGCAGGPRSGQYCEADSDCAAVNGPSYNPASVADFAAPDCSEPWKCVAIERHYRHVTKENIFELCAGTTDCKQAIDTNAALDAPAQLTLTGCNGCPDGGCESTSKHCAVDVGQQLDNLAEVNDCKPDLGAYEQGQPLPQYGPRPPGALPYTADFLSDRTPCPRPTPTPPC